MIRPPVHFETARLSARPPRVEDAPAVLAAYAADAEVTRYLSWRPYQKVEPLADFLRERIRSWETGQGHFAWLLCPKGTEEPIGSIGCTIEGGSVVFGYVLGRRHWGRGLMPEALGHLVGWALAQPGIFRAWAFCDAQNAASVRVMEKAGMSREGTLRRWHLCPNLGPEPRDCIVCSKVR